ncbi:MAG: hypothetical protein MJ097_02845 [Dorea sp.]|nr:hypothetical protein [Dorea sp.]
MKMLQREREITIYVPDDYQTSGKRYPVLYINDGQNAFFDNEAYCGCSWGFYDYVKWFNLDVIMVAIPCNFEPWKREAEYGPWLTNTVITIMETGKPNPRLGGEGDAYVQWIMTELKPYMDQNFPTNPEDTGICGSSAGGNISAYAAIKYPEVFKKCAALSCAIWYYPDEYEALIKESDLSPIECFYFDLGSNEGNGNTMITNYYKYTNERMYELLMQKGVDERIHFRVYEGAIHAEYEWRKRVPVFFELFGWTR